MSDEDLPDESEYVEPAPAPMPIRAQWSPGPKDVAALPPKSVFRTRVFDGFEDIVIETLDGAPLNTAVALHDRDPRLGPNARDYKGDPWNSVQAPERRFFELWKNSAGIVDRLPRWVRQLGVYMRWLEHGTFTGFGVSMLEAVAFVESSATNVQRELLHKQALERKEQSAIKGYTRQTVWNETLAAQARERKEREAAERLRWHAEVAARREKEAEEKEARRAKKQAWYAARAQAQALIETSRGQWSPGMVPVMLWLRPGEDIAALLGRLVKP